MPKLSFQLFKVQIIQILNYQRYEIKENSFKRISCYSQRKVARLGSTEKDYTGVLLILYN